MEHTGEFALRPLRSDDLADLTGDLQILATHLRDQDAGLRSVCIAEYDGELVGYVTLLWNADDPVLRDERIPEISDLRVSPRFRRRGIGTALMDSAEAEAASRSRVVGLNVGLHSGYGSAQRLYVRRGYLPDGAGVVVEGETVREGTTIRLDDSPIVTLRMMKKLVTQITTDDWSASLTLGCVRLFADPDGESHFESMNVNLVSTDFAPPAPALDVSEVVEGRHGFLRAPSGWFGDWHPTPARQFMCILSGTLELTVSDGEVRRMSGGGILLLEDTVGRGHSTRVISEEPAVLVFAQLP